jgi:UDP-N-acetylmuramate--alanine ligase
LGGAEALRDNFRRFASQSANLLYFGSDESDRLFASHPNFLRFDAADVQSSFAGFDGFQAVDAFLAVECAVKCGIDRRKATDALADFKGIDRRMTLRYQSQQLTVIEDYAHHPVELKASLELLAIKYPGASLRILFQPHRFARLERYLNEFAEVFKTSRVDEIFIAPVFAAWSEKGAVNHETLASMTDNAVAVNDDWQSVAKRVFSCSEAKHTVVAVIGAGDINKVLQYLVAEQKS